MYAAQIYRSVLPFVFVPVFLTVLGAETYSVISFFLTMVALLGLLDLGFSSAIIKMFSGSAHSPLKRLEATFLFAKFLKYTFLIAAAIFVLFTLTKDFLAYSWLGQSTDKAYVSTAILYLGLTIALTYIKQFLLCFLTSIENHVKVALFNIFGPTLGYGCGYLFLNLPSDLPQYFQILAIVCAAELLVLFFLYLRYHRESYSYEHSLSEIRTSFRDLLKPTFMLGAISLLWVVVSQSDKFLASYFMVPADFTYYQIGSQLSGVVAIMAIPLIQYLMPRLNRLKASGQMEEYSRTFLKPFMLFIFLSWNAVFAIFVNGQFFLSLWLSGDENILGVAEQSKYLFLAVFFSSVMQFIFLIIFSFNLLQQHLKVYMAYSLFAVLGCFLIAWSSPDYIGFWCFIHSFLFFLVWGGWTLSRSFKNPSSLFVVFFVVLPLMLYVSESAIKYFGFADSLLYYFSVRLAIFMLFGLVFLKFQKIVSSKVVLRWV